VDLQSDRTLATQVASGLASFIGGGSENTASGPKSTVGGGGGNSNSGDSGTIGGGSSNFVDSYCATVGGGFNNIVNGANYATISGGNGNAVTGAAGVVAGGSGCQATTSAYACGTEAKALHLGSHVITDSTNAILASTINNQYTSRFSGGYRLIGSPFSLSDRVTVYSDGAQTTIGLASADIYTIPAAAETAYACSVVIVAKTSVVPIDTAVFKSTVRAKRTAGVLTISAPFDASSDVDVAIAASSVQFVVSGTDIVVRVNGVVGASILWVGTLTITQL
jgi:hypothetical protein